MIELKRPRSWLDLRNAGYDGVRWNYARDHYTGDLLLPDRLMNYLIKKSQGETDDAFKERMSLADYTPVFPAVVDSLAGMLFAREGEANRIYTKEGEKNGPLGVLADHQSQLSRLWRDADGDGNGWLTLFKLLAAELTVTHKSWMLVDAGQDGNPTVKLIPAADVVNWRYENGVLVEALLRECSDTRTSIKDDKKLEEQYIYFMVDGWERWGINSKGEPVSLSPLSPYAYEGPGAVPTLPIFPVHIPLRRPIGWLLAKKANAIFNQESARDWLLRSCNFPRLVLFADDDLMGELLETLKKGGTVLQTKTDGTAHAFIAPDSGPATVATDVLKRKVEEFYVTAFREYGNAAAQKTATEVKQDVASGVGAYLQMLKAALDDAENNALWRLEQSLWPNDKSKWYVCSTERSDDFAPLDADSMMKSMKERYWPQTEAIPLGVKGLTAVAKTIAEHDGVLIDEDQLEAAITLHEITKQLAAGGAMDIPAEVRAEALNAFLVSTGIVDSDKMPELSPEEQNTLIKTIMDKARALGEAADTVKLREAETFPGQQPPVDPNAVDTKPAEPHPVHVETHKMAQDTGAKLEQHGSDLAQVREQIDELKTIVQDALAKIAADKKDTTPTPAPEQQPVTVNVDVTLPPPTAGETASISTSTTKETLTKVNRDKAGKIDTLKTTSN